MVPFRPVVLDIRARKKVSRAVDPLARAVARVGLTPTMVTIIGFVITVIGAGLVAMGELVAGAIVAGFGASLDILDGVLARLTGSETEKGAFLDSFTDRLGEVALWSGLVYFLAGEPLLVMLALASASASLLIPYLRAKAEGEGVEGKGGLMGRAERLLLLCFGFGLEGFGLPTLEPMLWAMAVLTWLTVAQRFYRTWVQLGE